MRVLCSSCSNGSLVLKPRDMTYFSLGNAYFCSPQCLVDHIKALEPVTYFDKYIHTIPASERATDGTTYSPQLDTTFRSGFEAVVAEYLILTQGFRVMYEPFLMKISDEGDAKVRHYIPDFYLPDHGVFLEVKGEWHNSKKKFKKALRLIGPDRLILIPPLFRGWFKRMHNDYAMLGVDKI